MKVEEIEVSSSSNSFAVQGGPGKGGTPILEGVTGCKTWQGGPKSMLDEPPPPLDFVLSKFGIRRMTSVKFFSRDVDQVDLVKI